MSIAEKLTTIVENEQKVYDAGKKSQYDEFWDDYQQNGTLTSYVYAFAGKGWTKENFRPKYDIKPINARLMFNYGGNNCLIDMVALSEELGIVFDFSNTTYFYQCFCGNFFDRLGVIDTTSSASLDGMFIEFQGTTIDKLIIRSNGTTTITSSFQSATNLKNITIEGVVGKDFNIQYSPLSKKSIENVVSVLSDATSSLTLTLSKRAVENAFSDEEWETLVATKPNWTISLI